MINIRSLLLVLVCALASPLARADTELNAARALLVDGRAGEAFDRLSGAEFARSGEPEFDYVFGLAALASGRPAIATLAFERVLAVAPDYAAAHLDMGRAYYALGDLERAEQSFAVARSMASTRSSPVG